MNCDFCGITPHDPTSLKPVHEVTFEYEDHGSAETGPLMVPTAIGLGEEKLACEGCHPEVSEPERAYLLEHQCPRCWDLNCACSPEELAEYEAMCARNASR